VDDSIGACACVVDDLDVICDLECRLSQQSTIQLVCPDPLASTTPFIRYWMVSFINAMRRSSARPRQKQQLLCGFVSVHGILFSRCRVTFPDGSYEEFPTTSLTNVINVRSSIFPSQCTSGIQITQPVYLMESNIGAFLAVYEPDADFVVNQLKNNAQVDFQW